MRTISIGAQGFDSLIEHGYFYVDKTSFIKEWWESGDVVTLITRPRRFGKTLNLDMMNCFFSMQYRERSDLFKGLKIWQYEAYRNLQGTFPVIFLSFARIKEQNERQAEDAICRLLTQTCGQFAQLLTSERLLPFEKRRLERYCEDVSADESADVLNFLSEMIFRHYQKKPLIFLDEYDTPLQESFVDGYWEEMSVYVRKLFNSSFKSNPYMERAILTGITRVSKESIFSDLNNLNVVTTTSSQYADSFGFTQKEVTDALDEYGLANCMPDVRKWYDGFRFGKQGDIYNPWSITNFLKNREVGAYWSNTSENSLIGYELQKSSPNIKSQMELLLNGESLEKSVDEQIIYSQLDRDENAIWSLFLSTGYLRIESRKMNDETGEWMLKLCLTNFEVRLTFRKMITGWFSSGGDFANFARYLILGDAEQAGLYLGRLLLEKASFFDTGGSSDGANVPENFYHELVLVLIASENNYHITSNRESGFGRYDILMRPKSQNLPGIIIEFKVFDSAKEKTLQETADRALEQIHEKRYDTELLSEGIPKDRILYYGMGFYGKQVAVREQKQCH